MRFAPGTPPSVIKKAEKEWLNSQKPSAGQRRYDNLASRPNLNPAQQRTMGRLGERLGINQQTAVTMPTGKPGVQEDVDTSPAGSPPQKPIVGRPLPPQTPPRIATEPIPVGPGAGAMGGGMPPAGNVQQTVSGGPPPNYGGMTMKKGGKVKNMASGGMTSKSSASSRGDGIASRGKTKCKMY